MTPSVVQVCLPRPSRARVTLAYAAIYLLWGSTYLGIRFALESLPPLLMMGARFLAAGALIFLFLLLRGAQLPGFSLWLPAVAAGVPLVTITYGLLAWAQQTVPSGLAALLNSMIPLWMVILDWVRPRGIRPRWTAVAGIGLGIAGVGLLVNPPGRWSSDGVSVVGAGMLAVSGVSWSLGSVFSRHVPQPVSKAQAASMMMMSGGALLLLVALLAGEAADLELGSRPLKSWLALAYLVGVATIGHTSYLWLLSMYSASKVASYAFVNPVVALILGVLLAGESLSLWTLVCSGMIISAVVIIVTSKSRSEDATAVAAVRRPVQRMVRLDASCRMRRRALPGPLVMPPHLRSDSGDDAH